MNRWTLGLFVFASLAMVVRPTAAQQPKPPAAMIYIHPGEDPNFKTYIEAAIIKKKVPASVVEREELATLTLKASAVEEHKETTGSKVVKCLFAYCADTADKANASVTLVNSEGVVVWSYAVNKARGQKNRQAMAEAIASHMKSEYFHQ